MARNRKTVIDRVIKSILFMQRYKHWTIEDLSDHIETTRREGARYVRDLSRYLPIIEVKPLRYGPGPGLSPILFSLQTPLWGGKESK